MISGAVGFIRKIARIVRPSAFGGGLFGCNLSSSCQDFWRPNSGGQHASQKFRKAVSLVAADEHSVSAQCGTVTSNPVGNKSSTLGNCSDGLRWRATDFDYRCEANHLAAITSRW